MEGERKIEQSPAERILALMKSANLTKAELEMLAYEINTLVELKRVAQVTETATQMSPEKTTEPKEESEQKKPQEERNQFGLPHSWSRQTSLKGLDFLRESLQRVGSPDSRVIGSAVREFLTTYVRPEYQQYRGVEADFDTRIDITNENSEMGRAERTYLMLPEEEKLPYLQKVYPKGMPLLGLNNKFLKWEKIIDYELWAFQNHSQTFATIARRGGLDPYEAISIIFSVKFSRNQFSQGDIMKFFEQYDFFAT